MGDLLLRLLKHTGGLGAMFLEEKFQFMRRV